VLGLNNL